MKPRTDEPKPGPFPVGTRVRYLGKVEYSEGRTGEDMVKVLYPGIEVVISKVAYGHRGTGRRIDDEDDDGPIYDETRDHVSVYYVSGNHGRCITRENKKEWQIIKGESK